MTKQNECSQKQAQINLVLEAKRIVIWAGELTQPGEAVGGIGTQNQRASRLLHLPIGVIVRARYERSGPEIFPSIHEARNRLLERIAKGPWNQLNGTWNHLQTNVTYEPRRTVQTATCEVSPGRVSRCG